MSPYTRRRPQPTTSTTTAHCAAAPPVATLSAYVVPTNEPVVPTKAGTSHPRPLQVPSPSGDLCITHRSGSRSPSDGECRGAMPYCRGWGGGPPQAYRAGGWEELRPPGAVTQGLLWEKARMRVQGTGNATKCNQMQLNLKFAAPAHAPSFPRRREPRIPGPHRHRLREE